MPKRPSAGEQSLQNWDPDEAPELTADYFNRAAIYDGETLIRRGRPKSVAPKRLTSLRLDSEVLAAFRASGPGWQTQINEVLKAYIRQRPMRGLRAVRKKPAKRKQSAA